MEILEQVDLSAHNTMALPCIADKVIRIYEESQLSQLPQELNEHHPFILGGGSNVILPPQLKRPVLQYLNNNLTYTARQDGSVLVEVGAGVAWDDLVKATVERGLRGLENLSLIPGSVGAAPVQNIGAYGVELMDVLTYVRVFEFATGTVFNLECGECHFAYRDSIFKQNPGHYLILQVGLLLSETRPFTLGYGELQELSSCTHLSAEDVRNEVIRVRQAKLPDPAVLPNSGSFFKNPVVSTEQKDRLSASFPNLVSYSLGDNKSKLAAGWLIDQAGWKGYRQQDIGIHERQALVIANYGSSSQENVLAIARLIQASVFEKFEVELEIEPVMVESF